MAAIRGAPTEAVKSGIIDSVTVEKPAASNSLAASPTDRQQKGQTGTSATTSTASCFIRAIMAGTLRSRNSFGFSRYPMNA